MARGCRTAADHSGASALIAPDEVVRGIRVQVVGKAARAGRQAARRVRVAEAGAESDRVGRRRYAGNVDPAGAVEVLPAARVVAAEVDGHLRDGAGRERR